MNVVDFKENDVAEEMNVHIHFVFEIMLKR